MEFDYDENEMKAVFSGEDYKENYRILVQKVRQYGENVPPLINAYMNISPSMNTFGTAVNETVVNRKGDTRVGGTVAYAMDAYYRDMGRYERQANPAARPLVSTGWAWSSTGMSIPPSAMRRAASSTSSQQPAAVCSTT